MRAQILIHQRIMFARFRSYLGQLGGGIHLIMPSMINREAVQHGVEYRSDEPPRPIPGFEQIAYSKRTSALWLHPETHGTRDALLRHLMNEFQVAEQPGHHVVLYWNDGPILDNSILNEVTLGAVIQDLIRTRGIYFMFVYIPVQ